MVRQARGVFLVGVVTAVCSACGSPSAPSSAAATLFELRITESPICAALTTDIARYGFFKFGTATVHVSGSFSQNAFVLVDDSLATFAGQCVGALPGGGPRPVLQFNGAGNTSASVSGRFDGDWFPNGCPGTYLGATGTVTGTRDSTSASGVLNGTLSNGIYALNNAGSCPATDHAWSLVPAK
jgi:hypothetical protein